MAEARMSPDRFFCLVCLNPPTDPVTTDCGHNFCMTCINEYWDQEDQRGVYSCPECTVKFTPRPNLRRNILLTEVSDSVKKTVQGASPAHRYAGLRRMVKEEQMKFEERIQEKQEKVEELRQAVDTVKLSAQTAVEDNERLLTEMISSMEKMHSEMTELIRAQEKDELSRAERLLEQLEQEITDLQRRVTELEQLSQTDDHLHFLQSFQSLHFSSGCDYSCRITVNQDLSFDGVRKSLCDLKKRIEEVCQEEFTKIPEHAAAVQIILPSEPKSREDFMPY
ncbi:E3 ubiquitin-protein ligase TRIM17-like [Ictalurus furcatus]|uniref:E3 ubiquitin-protein ligase TRIM17-like n=1 Tax=Ictalurus furcatus TaxID=66913 RepID=UPI0023503572|nr:E3 ubiquitin-protein ligase TRIM17-like [Ictalurus furcatus]